MANKIRIGIRSFDNPFIENYNFGGLRITYGRVDCLNHESYILCYDHLILIKSPENNFHWKSRKNIWS